MITHRHADTRLDIQTNGQTTRPIV